MSRRPIALMIALTILVSLLSGGGLSAAETDEGSFENPLIWADVPDPDIIRVGDAFYMTSTTMHMNPGVPIMKSFDLVHWEIVNYVYDILADNDEQTLRNGKSDYGKGSWASSLRYHNGNYYVVFASYSTGKTYIYKTANIEKGPWTRSSLDGVYHDMSLLFDDDGRVYLVYGGGDIRILELTEDATAIKAGGMDKVIIPGASLVASSPENVGLPAEGSHIQKINGYYYVFNITWPKNAPRTQIVHRATEIDGHYEGKVVLSDGVAQGGIVDTVDGKWYGLLFQDHGSVGRIPFLVPVSWENDWPAFGVDGRTPESIRIPVSGVMSKSLFVDSDEFYPREDQIGAYHESGSNAGTNASAAIAASTTLAAVSTAEAAPETLLAAPTDPEEILVNGGFEDGIEPWSAHDNATVLVVSDVYSSGSYSLMVSNRQATGAGLQQSLAGKVKAGGVYKFSAKVKYDGDETLPATKPFNFDIQDGDWTTIQVLGSATMTKGEWGTISGPLEAQKTGISTVYQEVNLCPNLSVAENIFIGRETRRFGRILWRRMNRDAEELLKERLNLTIDVTVPLQSYSVAIQQLVAIARALSISAKVLILDEPTSSLDQNEVAQLFTIMRKLKGEGMAILFVTHFLDQVYEMSDRLTVLRNGELEGEYMAAELPRIELVLKMIGKDLKLLEELPKLSADFKEKSGSNMISAVGLGRKGAIQPFDLDIRKGEVVGLAGLLGSGRTEIARLLFGADRPDAGRLTIVPTGNTVKSPRSAIDQGIAFCSENRKTEGIIDDLTVRENIILALQATRGWFRPISRKKQEEIAETYIQMLNINPKNSEHLIKNLSGGNQQKVLLARWLLTEPELLILDEPTRGIDVGAKAEIQKLVLSLAKQGMAVLFISSEMEEVIRVSDRIAVLRDRSKVKELGDGQINQHQIMQAMAGG